MLPQLPLNSTFPTGMTDRTWMERSKTLSGRLQNLARGLFDAPLVEPAASDWYTGLVIDPADFSKQLSNLHVSMQQANASARSGKAPVGVLAER